jgi:hypothetical protein
MWSLQRKKKARTGGDGTEKERRERDKTGTGREGEEGTGREKRGKEIEGIEKARDREITNVPINDRNETVAMFAGW